jgi:hypothetical protein
MQYKLIIKEEAKQDMLAAWQYYEEQIPGLGERFLTNVLNRFSDIAEHPEFYSFIDDRKILRDITVVCSTYRQTSD